MHANRTPSDPPAGPPADPDLATREVDSVSLVAAELALAQHDFAESGRREKAARSSYPPSAPSMSSLPPSSSRAQLTPMGPPAALYRPSSSPNLRTPDVYPAPARGPLFVLLVIAGVLLAVIGAVIAALTFLPP